MKNLFLFAFAFLVGCSGGCATPAAGYKPAKVETVGEFQYAVTLRVGTLCSATDPETGATGLRMVGVASAVAVAPRKAITAYHVVDDNCPEAIYVVFTYDDRTIIVKPTRIAPEADAALLEFADLKEADFNRYVVPSTAPLRLDDEVCSVGGDFSVKFMKKCGRVNEITTDYVHSSIWTKRGNSGGPLFRDRELVGIVVASFMDPMSEWQSASVPTAKWVHLVSPAAGDPTRPGGNP